MHCSAAHHLLFHERDRALAATEEAALARHLTACPACRELRQQLASAAGEWRDATLHAAVPDAADEWRALAPRLHGARERRPARRRGAPLLWLGVPLAAAAAWALGILVRPPLAPPPSAAPAVARAEFVEAGNADATTVVYVDDESGWLVVWASEARTHG